MSWLTTLKALVQGDHAYCACHFVSDLVSFSSIGQAKVRKRTFKSTGLEDAVELLVFCFFLGSSIPSARLDSLDQSLSKPCQSRGAREEELDEIGEMGILTFGTPFNASEAAARCEMLDVGQIQHL